MRIETSVDVFIGSKITSNLVEKTILEADDSDILMMMMKTNDSDKLMDDDYGYVERLKTKREESMQRQQIPYIYEFPIDLPELSIATKYPVT